MKTRICPDCGARELEHRKLYCSECSFIRREISKDLARFNWIHKNPEKYRECYMRSTKKYRSKLVTV